MRVTLPERARARLAAFPGRRIGVVGLGREGVDLARFLAGQGARVRVSDSASAEQLGSALAALAGLEIDYLLGNQSGEDLLDCAEIFVSPGVPRSAPVVAEAARAGIPISSATRLFFELCPGPILAVTGSSGKTTTTTLIGSIWQAAGRPMVVGGNMGIPVLGRLGELAPGTWAVLELSSFQLEDMTESPAIGVVLNITPNHLDRHPTMEDYIQAKGNLIRFQSADDIAVLNADDPIVRELPHPSRTISFSLTHPVDGTWLEDAQLVAGGRIPTRGEGPAVVGGPVPILSRAELPLRGEHNVANVLAAAAAALAAGCAPAQIASAVRAFRPVPHRLEVVAQVRGVTYVNDSIATSPERSMAALRSFDEPIVLIAGGRDKHLPMEDWARLIAERARAVVTVGEAASLVAAALERAGFRGPVQRARSFADVVPLAAELARPGDVALLSPGCTSFDEFRDYEVRGEAFRTAVRALERAEGGR